MNVLRVREKVKILHRENKKEILGIGRKFGLVNCENNKRFVKTEPKLLVRLVGAGWGGGGACYGL